MTISALTIITQWQTVFTSLHGENITMETHFGGPGEDYAQLFKTTNDSILFFGSTSSWGLGGGRAGLDGWFGKIDLLGNIIWNQTYGTNETDYIESIAECADGGFILVGTTFSWKNERYDNDILLIRTDSEGNLVWNQTFGGPEIDRAPKVLVCADGGFAIGCTTCNFGAEGWDLCLIRTDETGNPIWNVTYGGDEMDGLVDIIVTDTGFMLMGTSASFLEDPSSNNPDVYLVSTDVNGNMLWNRTYGDWREDSGTSILPLGVNSYLLIGSIGTHYSFGNIWVIQINGNGDVLWENRIEPHAACLDSISCFSGGFLLVGCYSSDMVFGSLDPYMIRLGGSGILIWDRICASIGIQDVVGSVVELADRSFLMAGSTSMWMGDVWLLRVLDISPSLLIALSVASTFLVGIIVAIATLSIIYLVQRRHRRISLD